MNSTPLSNDSNQPNPVHGHQDGDIGDGGHYPPVATRASSSHSLNRDPLMNQPIPSNSSEPLKAGDRVRILPEWQNESDEHYEHVVVEVTNDCSRVLIRTIVPGSPSNSTERIEARMLEFLSSGPQFASALNYVEGDKRVLIRNARGEYLARDGTWKIDRRQASPYFLSADKVAEQVEEADKLYGVKLVIEEVSQVAPD